MESFWSWLEASRPEVRGASRAAGAAAGAAVAPAAAEEALLRSANVAASAVDSHPSLAVVGMQKVGQSTASASSQLCASAIEVCACVSEESPTSHLELAAFADNVADTGLPVASASSCRRSRRKGKNKRNAEQD